MPLTLSLSFISLRSNILVPATVHITSMLAGPIVVTIAGKLTVSVAAAITKDPENQIISLPTPESCRLENRTVDYSPSLSPIGDVIVVCCKVGS